MKTFEEFAQPYLTKIHGEYVLTVGASKIIAIAYAKQAIERCAEVAEITDDYGSSGDRVEVIDRESILNVKKELK